MINKNDLPSYNIVIFHSYVQLAEGIIFVWQICFFSRFVWLQYVALENRVNNLTKEKQEHLQMFVETHTVHVSTHTFRCQSPRVNCFRSCVQQSSQVKGLQFRFGHTTMMLVGIEVGLVVDQGVLNHEQTFCPNGKICWLEKLYQTHMTLCPCRNACIINGCFNMG